MDGPGRAGGDIRSTAALTAQWPGRLLQPEHPVSLPRETARMHLIRGSPLGSPVEWRPLLIQEVTLLCPLALLDLQGHHAGSCLSPVLVPLGAAALLSLPPYKVTSGPREAGGPSSEPAPFCWDRVGEKVCGSCCQLKAGTCHLTLQG